MRCPACHTPMKVERITKLEYTNICYNICPKCNYKKNEYVKRMIPLSVEKRNNKRGK